MLKGHEDKALTIAFHPNAGKDLSPNGPNVATGSLDTTVRLWSLNPELEFQQSIVLGRHDERVNCVAFHPLGHYLVFPIAFQSDGSLLVTGDLNGVARVWDLRTGRCVTNLIGHVKRILSMAFMPNGYQLATGSDDNTVRIWDLRRRSSVYNLPAHHKLISDIRFEPTEGKFMVTASYDGVCKLWNTRDWQVAAKFAGHEAKMTSASPSRDGNIIVTTSADKTFKLWELRKEGGEKRAEVEVKKAP